MRSRQPRLRVLIGHRGVGKSTLLAHLERSRQWRSGSFVDLDVEIEKHTGKLLRQLFLEEGEAEFRKVEGSVAEAVFSRCLSAPTQNHWVAVGAGFPCEKIPCEAEVWWIRRNTDRIGRVFLDRPRLDPMVSDLEEYRIRAERREASYRRFCHHALWLPEGFPVGDSEELVRKVSDIVTGELGCIGAVRVWDPKVHHHNRFEQNVIVGLYEWREDLRKSDRKEFEALLSETRASWLLSLRVWPQSVEAFPKPFEELKNWVGELQAHYPNRLSVDWPLEWGLPPKGFRPDVASYHQFDGEETWNRMKEWQTALPEVTIKWSPFIASTDWDSLMRGDQWRREDVSHRWFLPRSHQGVWGWYRAMTPHPRLGTFVREGHESEGEVLDQPTLLEWLNLNQAGKVFGAVLGSPVFHSWTPILQGAFLKTMRWGQESFRGCFAIHCDHWRKDRMEFLSQLGLRVAAVTSPLKAPVASGLNELAVNSLVMDLEGKWLGTSTDEFGWTESVRKTRIAVGRILWLIWGGGGVKESLKQGLESLGARHLQFWSASRGSLQEEWQAEGAEADEVTEVVVVWAAPRVKESSEQADLAAERIVESIMENIGVSRGANLRNGIGASTRVPIQVWDLNYHEFSPGIELAKKLKCQYRSGAEMFLAQAQAQREFWARILSSEECLKNE